MDAVTVDPIVLGGIVLVALSIGVLIGATSGYWAASKDLDAEREKARRAGFDAGIETAWTVMPVAARDVVRDNLRALELRADDEQVSER